MDLALSSFVLQLFLPKTESANFGNNTMQLPSNVLIIFTRLSTEFIAEKSNSNLTVQAHIL